ncbi:cryptococcal mannosyltransferase 1 domain-containing protein [Penicillium odoratum]|uniref:cryptococcal mannosyltransferase 1 domain-containing protein n=1 Tax=Penicillium odoratum TaxID=1167516 RepID=UPI002547EADC|nr:cryptococcal mannosyltransferase 1 domain-containing protein [Penicillium odoratum]KAJ5745793.1 cryptococcal mannosyltransferase 1 domain-containing protein [Penicillium odoratum]
MYTLSCWLTELIVVAFVYACGEWGYLQPDITRNVINIVDTNQGRFLALCSLDFSKPLLYYNILRYRTFSARTILCKSDPISAPQESQNAIK